MEPFVALVGEFCRAHANHPHVQATEKALDQWISITHQIGEAAMRDPDEVNAAAYDYLMLAGYTVLAYFWARSAVTAEQVLASGSTNEAFYEAKLATARFYFERLLPRTESVMATIGSGAANLMRLEEQAFS